MRVVLRHGGGGVGVGAVDHRGGVTTRAVYHRGGITRVVDPWGGITTRAIDHRVTGGGFRGEAVELALAFFLRAVEMLCLLTGPEGCECVGGRVGRAVWGGGVREGAEVGGGASEGGVVQGGVAGAWGGARLGGGVGGAFHWLVHFPGAW